jgi:hypothetical protein
MSTARAATDNACCPFLGEEESRALGGPGFPGFENLPIRPRVASA